jgi:hypothetical protein
VDHHRTEVRAVDIGEGVPRPDCGERVLTFAGSSADESIESEAAANESVFQCRVGNEPGRNLGAE